MRYAPPSETAGDPCTPADPCTVEKAIEGTPNGDPAVQLFGGGYPPLAKACLSVRDFTIRLKRGVKARSISVTVDGKRATSGAASASPRA